MKMNIRKKIIKCMLILSLKLHSFFYKLSSYLAIRHEGKHPKHRVIDYADWFDKKINSTAVVIDIGSNTGQMTKKIAKSIDRKVYGIEIDAKHHDTAVKTNTLQNLKFILADATEFDYAEIGKVDVITLSNVLEHIADRQSFLSAIVNTCLWSSSGPRLLIRVPAIDREWPVLIKKELGIEWRLDKTHYTEYTNHQLIHDAEVSGLKLVTLERKFGEIYADFSGR